MDLNELTNAINEFYDLYPIPERQYIVRTGVGGMDLFDEAIENSVGLSRIYIGTKVPRFLRIKKFTILKSRGGKWYRQIGKVNLEEC